MLGQFGWVVLWENFVSFKLINNNRGMEMSDFKWDDHALGTLVMGLGALWQAVGKQWNGYVNALREKCSPIHQFDTAARQMWMWMSCSWLNCHFEMKKNANLCIWDKRKFAIVIKQAVQHSDGITILFWILNFDYYPTWLPVCIQPFVLISLYYLLIKSHVCYTIADGYAGE